MTHQNAGPEGGWTEDEIRECSALLSPERLAPFMPILCLFEIALRNAICERLRASFGSPDWLINPPAPFVWKDSEKDKVKEAQRLARRAAYTNKTQAEKRALDALAYPGGIPANIKHETRSNSRPNTMRPCGAARSGAYSPINPSLARRLPGT
jgi:hypothetical protein